MPGRCLITLVLAVLGPAVLTAAGQQPGYVGSETCATCHEDKVPKNLAYHKAIETDKRYHRVGQTCESCHGPKGEGGPKGSAITNKSFLALVSDQELRTIVIVGRPELGAPDWRGNLPSKPMSDQEVTDVVTWLASRRVANPGQPYLISNYEPH